MADIVSPLLQWLHIHPHLAGLVTFIISAGESVAIIGTIVPGSIMMTALGTLAGAGIIPLWSTIIWAILGAIVGDGISYWAGHYFKDQLPLLWPFRNYPRLLKTGENFFYKYGAMSVFIGRFVGPVRALVPLIAGMLGMRPIIFLIANVTSAIGWAPAYMLPGILLGAASLELPPDIAIHVMLVLLLIGLFIMLCLWFIYKIFQLIHLQITQLENRIWHRLEKSRRFHSATVILKHHDPEKTHVQFSLAIFLILVITLFTLLSIYVKCKGANHLFSNDVVYHFFRGLSHRSYQVDSIMLGFTLLGQKQVLLPVILAIAAWLFIAKHRRAALHVILLGFLAGGSIYLIKHLLKIPRPWGIFYNAASPYSMPSGHTALATVFYIGFVLLLCSSIQQRLWRTYLYRIAVIIALIISISRLYLGAHWFTDIISSWLLATALLIFVTISYLRQREEKINPLHLLCVGLISLAFFYSFFYVKNINKLMVSYQQKRWPITQVVMGEWWGTNNSLPAYRTSLFGIPSQQINIQWAGNFELIRDTLIKQGWSKPPARDFISILHRVADISSTQYLPLISPQYLDRKPQLILMRTLAGNNDQIVIRLWNSHRQIKETGETIWVGVVGFIPRSYGWLFNNRSTNLMIEPSLIFSKNQSEQDWQWKLMVIDLRTKQNRIYHPLILLIRRHPI